MTLKGGEQSIPFISDSTFAELQDKKSIGKVSFGSKMEKEAAKNQKEFDGWLDSQFDTTWDMVVAGDGVAGKEFDKNRYDLFDRYAPAASDMFRIAKGPDWFNQLTDSEVSHLKRIARHGGKKEHYASSIVTDKLWVSGGQVRIPGYEDGKLELINTAIGYDTERRGLESEVRSLADRIKSINLKDEAVVVKSAKEREIDNVVERFDQERKAARDIFSSPEMKIEELGEEIDLELNRVLPTILDNAELMSPEATQRLLTKLGITRNKEDGTYTAASNDRSTESQHAMYMVLQQLVRNRQIQLRDENLQSLVNDGNLDEIARNSGADLLVLHAFEVDSSKDCGRFFQEEVRRTILRTRIEEISIVEESGVRTKKTERDERWLRGAIKGLEEAYFFAEDIFKMVGKKMESVFRRQPDPESFMARVIGFGADLSGGLGEYFGNLADDLPDEIPERVRMGLSMPDLFREFD